jgi:hemin uptake protein HemP
MWGFQEDARAGVPDKPNQPDRQAAEPPTAKTLRTISSRDLLGRDRLVIIRHEQEDYRLQVTATGKLILTK